MRSHTQRFQQQEPPGTAQRPPSSKGMWETGKFKDSPRFFPGLSCFSCQGLTGFPALLPSLLFFVAALSPRAGQDSEDTSSSPWGRGGPALLPPVSALVWTGRERGEQKGHDTEALLFSLGHKGLTANVQSCRGARGSSMHWMDQKGRDWLGLAALNPFTSAFQLNPSHLPAQGGSCPAALTPGWSQRTAGRRRRCR